MQFLMMNYRSRANFVILLFLLVNLTACTIRFISSYDEQTDKSVTALQRTVESFFVSLENLTAAPECTYDHQKTFYNNTKVEISALQVRTDAIDKNELTSKQMELLSNSLKTLEQLHQLKQPGERCFTREEIQPLRQNFNTIFTSILKLELAKKREVPRSTESN